MNDTVQANSQDDSDSANGGGRYRRSSYAVKREHYEGMELGIKESGAASLGELLTLIALDPQGFGAATREHFNEVRGRFRINRAADKRKISQAVDNAASALSADEIAALLERAVAEKTRAAARG